VIGHPGGAPSSIEQVAHYLQVMMKSKAKISVPIDTGVLAQSCKEAKMKSAHSSVILLLQNIIIDGILMI
jgi:hypothetical protein